MEITKKLFEKQDLEYQEFARKLTPNIEPESIIGVRVPIIRELAKDFVKSSEYDEFINTLPHKYYEENLLHSILLSKVKDYDLLIELTEKFNPFINNWAVCDTLRPTCYKKHLDDLEKKAYSWIESNHEFTIRHGIDTLMTYYIKDNFKEEYLEKVASVVDTRYYVQMMVAWFFTESLINHWDLALPYIKEKRLSSEVTKMTIRKCLDSYKLSQDKKDYLKELRSTL